MRAIKRLFVGVLAEFLLAFRCFLWAWGGNFFRLSGVFISNASTYA